VESQRIVQRAIKAIKAACPEMVVMPDAVLGPYSIYGHDGIIESGAVFGFISKRFSQISSIKTNEEVLKLITNAFPKSVKVYTIFKCLQKKSLKK
jgi:delta-aminolevulinic acid dehydratase/porphobilinogen synthase